MTTQNYLNKFYKDAQSSLAKQMEVKTPAIYAVKKDNHTVITPTTILLAEWIQS